MTKCVKSKVVPLSYKTENQKDYILSIIENDITFCTGPSGTGKAQPLDSIVVTPNGPVNMGSVKIHDNVCVPHGGVAKITAIYPQGKKMVYSINFKNGHSVECCEDHLWLVEKLNRSGTWEQKVITTKEMLQEKLFRSIYTDRGIWNRYIYRIKPISYAYFNDQEITIDPYILGVILGDGGITQGNIIITSNDKQIIDLVRERLPEELKIKKISNKYCYSITKKEKSCPQIKNPYKEHLKNLNLMGKSSLDKKIPNEYKYNSLSVRLDLIRGLMDTDGCVDKNGNIEYSSSSIDLAYDMKEILESLGCIVSINRKETTHNYSYRLYIKDIQNLKLFSLDRKLNRLKKKQKGTNYHYISSISRIGVKDCQCISIDDDKHLYITNNFIPTHNTFIASGLASEKLHKGDISRIVVTRPLVCTGKDIGALPGELDEKIMPYLLPLEENFRFFLGDMYKDYFSQGFILYKPLELMRGSTFNNAIMILDEAQNCTLEQLKMFITRIGQDSKVIINGDLDQTDLRKTPSSLLYCINKLKDIKGIGNVKFDTSDIQRNGIIGKVLKALES